MSTSPPSEHFPFRGTVIWLTADQGGRPTGPPEPRTHWPYYAANGWLPPRSADDGLRSLVLRGFLNDQWRSPAEATWLVELDDDPHVEPGSVLVVSEGPRPVAFFLVDEVGPAPSGLVDQGPGQT